MSAVGNDIQEESASPIRPFPDLRQGNTYLTTSHMSPSEEPEVVPNSSSSSPLSKKRKGDAVKSPSKRVRRPYIKPKGEVKWDEAGLMWFKDRDFPKWTRAAYHEDFRGEFIKQDSAKGRWDVQPRRGKGDAERDDDDTSFEPAQASWGPSRDRWENIVNTTEHQVMRLDSRPTNLPKPTRPKFWVHDGMVLLDQENHALRQIPGLNRTFSSQIEAFRLEALRRLLPHAILQDFRGRMPRTRVSPTDTGRVPIPSLVTFTNRLIHFRKEFKLPAWRTRIDWRKPQKVLDEDGSKVTMEDTIDSTDSEAALQDEAEFAEPLDETAVHFGGTQAANESCMDVSPNSRTRAVASGINPITQTQGTNNQAQFSINPDNPTQSIINLSQAIQQPAPNQQLDTFSSQELFGISRGQLEWYLRTPGRQLGSYLTLTPLFATMEDEAFAESLDNLWTTPVEVLKVRILGPEFTEGIKIYWYPEKTLRAKDDEGKEHRYAVGIDMNLQEALGIPKRVVHY